MYIGEAGLRDYLCSWLCLLMVEQYQVEAEESHGMEVVQSKLCVSDICYGVIFFVDIIMLLMTVHHCIHSY